MLKFNAWPPAAGNVEFSNRALQIISEREQAMRDLSESDVTIIAVEDMGYAAGATVSANTQQFTAQRIGQELMSSIGSESIQHLFAGSYEEGVQAEVEARGITHE